MLFIEDEIITRINTSRIIGQLLDKMFNNSVK
jgi:hypothetical protein